MQFENWISFCAIALLATATPGTAVMLVSLHSLSFGFKKSLTTVLGNVTGLFIMSGLSVLGLSTIVIHSVTAFTIVKLIGAIYLIIIGVKLWRNGLSKLELGDTKIAKSSFLNLYTQGVLVALTNPKAIIFTTALFPQFIVVSDPLLPQFMILVFSFMCLSFICLCVYALLAQRTKSKIENKVAGKWISKAFGTTFICSGCALATMYKS